MNNSPSYAVINSNISSVNDSLFQDEPQQESSTNDTNEIDDSLIQQNSNKQLNRCITAFSSGTGLAGIVGYGYKSLLAEAFGWGLSAVVFSVIFFAAAYYATFYCGLYKEEKRDQFDRLVRADERDEVLTKNPLVHTMLESSRLANVQHGAEATSSALELVTHSQKNVFVRTSITVESSPDDILSPTERFRLVLSLWPYTIPLFTVYAAEYMLQVRNEAANCQ